MYLYLIHNLEGVGFKPVTLDQLLEFGRKTGVKVDDPSPRYFLAAVNAQEARVLSLIDDFKVFFRSSASRAFKRSSDGEYVASYAKVVGNKEKQDFLDGAIGGQENFWYMLTKLLNYPELIQGVQFELYVPPQDSPRVETGIISYLLGVLGNLVSGGSAVQDSESD